MGMTNPPAVEATKVRRRRTRRTGVPKRAVGRRRVMLAEVRGAADPIEPALWIGQRIRRFKPIVGHP
jgi:hypothetical protein